VSATPLVSVDGLGVTFRDGRRLVRAVEDLRLAIPTAGRVALLGESGSGKTATALAIAGLLPEEAVLTGRIEWPALGRPPVLGRDVGVVFQDPMSSLNPVLTIGEQIAEVPVTHQGLGWRAAMALAQDLLARVGIPEHSRQLRSYPHELSGGQRQRVAIAMAIAAGPRLLIADEPTTALDTVVQAQILSLLAEITATAGTALLLVTHDLAVASGAVDVGAVLYAGRLVETGPIASLVQAPRHPYTQGLLAASLDPDCPPAGRLAEILGTPPDPSEPLGGCPFAPRCPHLRADCLPTFPQWRGAAGDGVACVLHGSA
jgi:peptide/nickel transport system ATP-binding protein